LSTSAATPVYETKPSAHRRGVILVVICTLIGALAQILMKMGADYTLLHPGLRGLLTNTALLAGYAIYGLTTVLLVVAYKDGELSVLYPIFSLSYVWVTVASIFVFHDTANVSKLSGVAVIITGVAVLSRGAKK
jgi:undecaprenyl phosphate-alpha-L-ara4N flippase subunit ArnE